MSPEQGLAEGFLECLAKCFSLIVAVDTTAPGLVIPQYLKDEGGSCFLEFGLNLAIPINDLEVTVEGIRATLSFKREPHPVFIPWCACQAIQTKGMPGVAELPPVRPAPEPRPRGNLRAIGPEEIYSASAEDIAEAVREAGALGRPTMLRVVN